MRRSLTALLALAAIASCGNIDDLPTSTKLAHTSSALSTPLGTPAGAPTGFMRDADFENMRAQRKLFAQQHPEREAEPVASASLAAGAKQ